MQKGREGGILIFIKEEEKRERKETKEEKKRVYAFQGLCSRL